MNHKPSCKTSLEIDDIEIYHKILPLVNQIKKTCFLA